MKQFEVGLVSNVIIYELSLTLGQISIRYRLGSFSKYRYKDMNRTTKGHTQLTLRPDVHVQFFSAIHEYKLKEVDFQLQISSKWTI